MNRHQGNPLGALLPAVEIRNQGHLIEEEFEFTPFLIGRLFVGQVEIPGAGHQLEQVVATRLGFGTALLRQAVQVARTLEQSADQLVEGAALGFFAQFIQQGEKITNLPRYPGGGLGTELTKTRHHRNLLTRRENSDLVHGRLADPSRGSVDDPQQGLVIRGIDDEPQVRHGVLDLRPIVKADSAHHRVGHVVFQQFLFEGSRLRIGAVENREIAVGPGFRSAGGGYFPNHVGGFFAIVIRFEELDQVATFAFGEEALLLALNIVGDHRRCTREDGLGGTVIALELDHLGFGVVLLEIKDVPDVGAAPCVDGLVGISYHTEIPMPRCQKIHQIELHAIGVLELVDENVLPTLLVELENTRTLLEEFHRLQEKIAEIKGVGVDEHTLVDAIETGRKFIVDVVGIGRGLGGKNPGVLPLVDPPANPFGVVRLRIQSLALQRLLDDPDAIGIVIDHEPATAPQVTNIPAKDSYTDGMKGANGEISTIRAEQFLDALLHFARRLVGKGDGQQAGGRDPADPDQIGDPACEYTRLPAPGAREDQQGALGGFHGAELFGVEAGRNRFSEQILPLWPPL